MTDKPKVVDNRKELILIYINQNGQITNKEARNLLNVSATTVRRILDEMIHDKILVEEANIRAENTVFLKTNSFSFNTKQFQSNCPKLYIPLLFPDNHGY